ncbi:MAG: hypothetical protein IJM42_05825 [Synergistes sp.]|nr:hypothetical protein [Synergistes sp.]MCR5336046.1 hypothetical protein [Synergistes sp.]
MIEQFEKVNEALDRLEKILSDTRAAKEALEKKVLELNGIIEDRDLEILQLQEEAEKSAASTKAEKEEISGCLEGLLGRMYRLTSEEQQEQ